MISKENITRIRGASTDLNNIVRVGQMGVNIPVAVYALASQSGVYYYDNTDAQWRYWGGMQAATNITALPQAPFTLGLNYFYRISGTDLQLWQGSELNDDAIPDTTIVPYCGSFLHGWSPDSALWMRVEVDENGRLFLANFTDATVSNRTEEIDPLSQHFVSETLADVTDGTDGTYYYYLDMDGYTELALQLILDGGSGTVTCSVEATLQPSTAPASCTYADVSNAWFGAANWTASAYLTNSSGRPLISKYTRIKVVAVTGDDSGDWTIYSKRLYA